MRWKETLSFFGGYSYWSSDESRTAESLGQTSFGLSGTSLLFQFRHEFYLRKYTAMNANSNNKVFFGKIPGSFISGCDDYLCLEITICYRTLDINNHRVYL
jgi:hypothetical protein